MPAAWWRLKPHIWEAILEDDQLKASYYGRCYRTDTHVWFLGAIDDSGHGRIRIPRRLGNHVVPAHLLGYQYATGLMPSHLVVRHRCDESACQSGAHLVAGTSAKNAQDYQSRRGDQAGPLADRRGPDGRARAIRDVILAGIKTGLPAAQIQRDITRVAAAGLPGVQGSLF